ncbi:MAG: hypothetical protein R2712_13725 [Vicinamibacterales bacterium]
MSATLGDTGPFELRLTALNGRPTVTVRSAVRPVPLEYTYAEIALPHTIERLVEEGRTPAYVVHFTQADAAGSAQDFTSLKIATREQKADIAARIADFDFSSQYAGADVRKWLLHGIGLHHAGLLPKYRVLVEQLAQRSLLRVICGTDTLGAGINVPISHRRLHEAVQVRRPEDGAPHGAGVPPDRGPGGTQGLRRCGVRGGAGARARDREPAPVGEGRPRRSEGGEAQAARTQLRALGRQHVRAPEGGAARASSRASRCRTACC